MESKQELTVGQWVAYNYKASSVFRKYGIDFCCGGGISIQKACQKKGIPEEQLLLELENISTEFDEAIDLKDIFDDTARLVLFGLGDKNNHIDCIRNNLGDRGQVRFLYQLFHPS